MWHSHFLCAHSFMPPSSPAGTSARPQMCVFPLFMYVPTLSCVPEGTTAKVRTCRLCAPGGASCSPLPTATAQPSTEASPRPGESSLEGGRQNISVPRQKIRTLIHTTIHTLTQPSLCVCICDPYLGPHLGPYLDAASKPSSLCPLPPPPLAARVWARAAPWLWTKPSWTMTWTVTMSGRTSPRGRTWGMMRW